MTIIFSLPGSNLLFSGGLPSAFNDFPLPILSNSLSNGAPEIPLASSAPLLGFQNDDFTAASSLIETPSSTGYGLKLAQTSVGGSTLAYAASLSTKGAVEQVSQSYLLDGKARSDLTERGDKLSESLLGSITTTATGRSVAYTQSLSFVDGNHTAVTFDDHSLTMKRVTGEVATDITTASGRVQTVKLTHSLTLTDVNNLTDTTADGKAQGTSFSLTMSDSESRTISDATGGAHSESDTRTVTISALTATDSRNLADVRTISLSGVQSETGVDTDSNGVIDHMDGTLALKSVKLTSADFTLETAAVSVDYGANIGANGISTSSESPLGFIGSVTTVSNLALQDALPSTFDALVTASLTAANKVTLLHAIVFDAGEGADTVIGSSGNDTIYGGGGFDSLSGGAGNDVISVSLEGGVVDGGLGTDTVFLGFSPDDSLMVSGTASALVITDLARTSVVTLKNVENITLGSTTMTTAAFLASAPVSTLDAHDIIDLNGTSTAEISLRSILENSQIASDGISQPAYYSRSSAIDRIPFTTNLLGDDGVSGILGRIDGQSWTTTQNYNDWQASHALSYVAGSGAKLTWKDLASATDSPTAGSTSASGTFAYTAPTGTTDRLTGTVTFGTSWSQTAAGVRTDADKSSIVVSGIDGHGTASTADDATFSSTIAESRQTVVTGFGSSAEHSVYTDTTTGAFSYSSGTTANKVALSTAYSQTEAAAYSGTDGRDLSQYTSDLVTTTLSSYSYQNKDDGLTVSMAGKDVWDRLTQHGVTTLTGVTMNTESFTSTTARVTYNYYGTQDQAPLADLFSIDTLDPAAGNATSALSELVNSSGTPEAINIAIWGGDNKVTLLQSLTFYAGDGSDTVTGSAADDDIYGGSGFDNLSGAAGNDYLEDDIGGVIDGGAGIDSVFIDGLDSYSYAVTGTAAKFTITTSDGYVTTVANAEWIYVNGAWETTADFVSQASQHEAISAADLFTNGGFQLYSYSVSNLAAMLPDNKGAFQTELNELVAVASGDSWTLATKAYVLGGNNNLSFTAADGATISWTDNSSTTESATSNTLSEGASVTYKGGPAAETKADALSLSFKDAYHFSYDPSKLSSVDTAAATLSYSGVDGHGTAVTTDDTKFSFSRTMTSTTTHVYGDIGQYNWTESIAVAASFARGTAQTLTYAVTAKSDYAESWTPSRVDQGQLTDTVSLDREVDTLTKFSYADTTAGLSISFTGTATRSFYYQPATHAATFDHETDSETVKSLAISTTAFTDTAAGFSATVDAWDQTWSGMLSSIRDGGMDQATSAVLATLIPSLLQGNDVMTLKVPSGTDTVFSYGGNDKITGSIGADHIDAGAGNDTVNAGTGDDFIFASRGTDVVDGGTGTDKLVFDTLVSDLGLGVSDLAGLAGQMTMTDITGGYRLSITGQDATVSETGVERIVLDGHVMTMDTFFTTYF